MEKTYSFMFYIFLHLLLSHLVNLSVLRIHSNSSDLPRLLGHSVEDTTGAPPWHRRGRQVSFGHGAFGLEPPDGGTGGPGGSAETTTAGCRRGGHPAGPAGHPAGAA